MYIPLTYLLIGSKYKLNFASFRQFSAYFLQKRNVKSDEKLFHWKIKVQNIFRRYRNGASDVEIGALEIIRAYSI